jgi:hypothetical protein
MGKGPKALGVRTGGYWTWGGPSSIHTWLFWPTLLPDTARQVVRSVPLHTTLTGLQLFAAPLDSRPDVQANQGSPPKASSSFTWEWDGSGMGAAPGSQATVSPPLLRLTHLQAPGAPTNWLCSPPPQPPRVPSFAYT